MTASPQTPKHREHHEVREAQQGLTVGQVAAELGVTVRTLHHYDEIGLVRPSSRGWNGYRRYTPADLERLQHVVVYRRLELSLEEIGGLLAHPASAREHLRRQREVVTSRVGELEGLVRAIDRALEDTMNEHTISREEQRELFGDAFDDGYAEQAQQRWGDTPAWEQSQQRTKEYSKADWEAIKADADAVNAGLAAAMAAGPATSGQATDAAEAHRAHITRWFYDCSYPMHRGLGDLYVTDPRFTKTYDDVAPGLAQFVRDAIHANADRAHG